MKKPSKATWRILLALLCVVVLFLIGMAIEQRHSSTKTTTETEYYSSTFNAKAYLEATSKILNEIPAQESKSTLSEKEAADTLINRGFSQYSISTNYSMSGEYYASIEIDKNAAEEHPMYETFYQAENGELWKVYSVNGIMMAFPITYNITSGAESEVMLSETDSVMSYDSQSNTFYENIPNDSTMIVVVVDKIDAQTLEQMTIEEIDRHVG